MPFVVVYDANVLYPSTLRDLLLRIAQSGLVQAKWTEHILQPRPGHGLCRRSTDRRLLAASTGQHRGRVRPTRTQWSGGQRRRAAHEWVISAGARNRTEPRCRLANSRPELIMDGWATVAAPAGPSR